MTTIKDMEREIIEVSEEEDIKKDIKMKPKPLTRNPIVIINTIMLHQRIIVKVQTTIQ